jgi:RNA polymerase sigma-70 factor (ECF subfamily)
MPDSTRQLLTEDALIRSAQGGDLEAFSELVRIHHQGVYAYLVVRLSGVHDADDLSQEVFVTAFRKLSDFDPERPLAPWLRSIALNLLRNHRRKFRPESIGGNEELQALLEAQIESGLATGNESGRLIALRECLERLEAPVRKLLLAHYGDGVTLRELASQSGRSYSAVAMQIHRVRELLAACVESRLAPAS